MSYYGFPTGRWFNEGHKVYCVESVVRSEKSPLSKCFMTTMILFPFETVLSIRVYLNSSSRSRDGGLPFGVTEKEEPQETTRGKWKGQICVPTGPEWGTRRRDRYKGRTSVDRGTEIHDGVRLKSKGQNLRSTRIGRQMNRRSFRELLIQVWSWELKVRGEFWTRSGTGGLELFTLKLRICTRPVSGTIVETEERVFRVKWDSRFGHPEVRSTRETDLTKEDYGCTDWGDRGNSDTN